MGQRLLESQLPDIDVAALHAAYLKAAGEGRIAAWRCRSRRAERGAGGGIDTGHAR
jgi:hypothetical protein